MKTKAEKKQKVRKTESNRLEMTIPAISRNEAFARQSLCSFAAQCNPTLEEIGEFRIIISEAVTNCVVHAYRGGSGDIHISAVLFSDKSVRIRIRDRGCGMENIEQSMQPFYTTDTAGERGGMGFPIMKELSDRLTVRSRPGSGTIVTLYKKFSSVPEAE